MIADLAVDHDARPEVIESVRAEAVGPPEGRMLNNKIQRDVIRARSELDLALRCDPFTREVIHDDGCVRCRVGDDFNFSREIGGSSADLLL